METIHMVAKACTGGSFLMLPKWYAYLPSTTDSVSGKCMPSVTNINDIWLIVAAIIEMLLRISALVAVFMVIAGGVKYMTSQGSSEATAKARNTLIYALVGLLISVSASIIVAFTARAIGA